MKGKLGLAVARSIILYLLLSPSYSDLGERYFNKKRLGLEENMWRRCHSIFTWVRRAEQHWSQVQARKHVISFPSDWYRGVSFQAEWRQYCTMFGSYHHSNHLKLTIKPSLKGLHYHFIPTGNKNIYPKQHYLESYCLNEQSFSP